MARQANSLREEDEMSLVRLKQRVFGPRGLRKGVLERRQEVTAAGITLAVAIEAGTGTTAARDEEERGAKRAAKVYSR